MDKLPNSLTPLCFNRHEFTKGNFNVETFLTQTRRHVPLDQIKDDLHVYLKILQNAMIELINKDYADFVNLSSNLVNLQGTVEKLQGDLDGLYKDFGQYATQLSSQAESLQTTLNSKVTLRQRQQRLRAEAQLLRDLEKAKMLLRRDINVELVERLTPILSNCRLLASKLSLQQQSQSELNQSVEAVTKVFLESLRYLFEENIEGRNTQAVSIIIRGYKSCKALATAQVVFIQKFMDPLVKVTLTEKGKSATVLLPVLFEKLLGKLMDLHNEYLLVFIGDSAVTLEGKSPTGVNFLIFCLSVVLQNSLDEQFNSVLVPSDPDVFYGCYSQLVKFADELASRSPLADLVRANRSLRLCFGKFSLPVYFQLRQQEILRPIEELEESVTLWDRAGPEGNFRSKYPTTLLRSLELIWERPVFLTPICDRFFELFCQLLSRFISYWVEKTSTIEEWPPTPTNPPAKAIPSAMANGSVKPRTRLTSTQSGEEESLRPKISDLLSRVIVDAVQFRLEVEKLFSTKVQAVLMESGVKNMELFDQLIQDWTKRLETALDSVKTHLAAEVAQHSRKLLLGVNEIPRQYRWTRKDAPSNPSVYIQTAFSVLTDFIDHSANILPSATITEVNNSCLTALVPDYADNIRKVLVSNDQITKSLKTLKKSNTASGQLSAKANDGATSLSDDEKIRLQLNLDIKEFQRLVAGDLSKHGILDQRVMKMVAELSDLLKPPSMPQQE